MLSILEKKKQLSYQVKKINMCSLQSPQKTRHGNGLWVDISCDHMQVRLYSLPNDKILDWSKFKTFAFISDSKIEFGRVENTVGKGENAGYQHFFLFPQCFLTLSFHGVFKVGIVW